MFLPLAAETGGDYAAAAYLVFLIVLVIYLAIMANKLVKIQGTLSRILKKLDDTESSD